MIPGLGQEIMLRAFCCPGKQGSHRSLKGLKRSQKPTPGDSRWPEMEQFEYQNE